MKTGTIQQSRILKRQDCRSTLMPDWRMLTIWSQSLKVRSTLSSAMPTRIGTQSTSLPSHQNLPSKDASPLTTCANEDGDQGEGRVNSSDTSRNAPTIPQR